MALTQYCEFGEVRAALGVNARELPDSVLALPIYEIGLVRELSNVSASLSTAFFLVSAVDVSARSTQQQQLSDAVRMFSVYACAKQVAVALASLAPKDVSDGKASTSRFSDAPYRDVQDRLDIAYQRAKAFLLDALSAYSGGGTPNSRPVATAFRSSVRSYDPVTG